MKKQRIGTTELFVSEAGFGVLALGENHGAVPEDQGAELLLYGLERGIPPLHLMRLMMQEYL